MRPSTVPSMVVRQSSVEMGFVVTPVTAEHPAFRRLAILPNVLRKILIERPVMLFQTIETLVHKPLTRQQVPP